jgi:glycosyltransferase involved in cell wall biosynthesis
LGGFDKRKNLATVLNAYRLAAPTVDPACALVIAGRLPDRDTPFTPDPRRLARDREIDDGRVQFLGAVDKGSTPALYRGATAFIFASRYEGFGLPPLEAMACGTPVVGSNASSIPEVVGDGGILYDPDDAAGMASALVRLSTDSAFRTEMTDRALAQAARFSWARTAEQTRAAYHDVMAARQ